MDEIITEWFEENTKVIAYRDKSEYIIPDDIKVPFRLADVMLNLDTNKRKVLKLLSRQNSVVAY